MNSSNTHRLLTVLAVIACQLSFGSVFAQKTLTILHTNDSHSTILPLNPNLADTLLAGKGGYLRRIAMLEEERAQDPDLLLFDSGDFSQGSAFYSLFQGDVEIGLMNQMHYDAATIGNHEFDFGLENMVRIFRQAQFPIVCSNYDFADTELKDIVKPYIVLKKKGVRIGVFALCPPLEGLVFTKNYGPLRYQDPVETTSRMVDILKRQKKCDLVICISHLGWGKGEDADNYVIQHTRGVDLVLGGHTHTYFKQLRYVDNLDGKPVGVDQNGKHAAFVGKLVLTLNKK
ncbi:MAG: bifunctional metallophosphatase/5'-nucleotidase [Prevotella sp.]|nr:bifunctional metallophosphatase/5'-nucleotidase [Prevotella sp.]